MTILMALFLLAAAGPAAAHAGHAAHDKDAERVEAGGAPPAGSGPFTIEDGARVIDGDTIEVNVDGSRVGVKLVGIDAPQANTACGKVATAQLNAVVGEGTVRLEDVAGANFNEQGLRLYRAVEPGSDSSVAQKVVQAGVATVAQESAERGPEATKLAGLQKQARTAKRGCVWDEQAPDPGGTSGKDGTAEPEAQGAVRQGAGIAILGQALRHTTAWLSNAVDLLIPDAVQGYLDTRPANAQTAAGFRTEAVASGIAGPTSFAFLPDGRILIASKRGVVYVYKNGQILPTPFIDISGQVNDYWDRGLLSVAADANFENNGYVYLAFTYENDRADYEGSKTARVIRVTANGDTANPASSTTLLGSQVGATCKDFPIGADCLPSDYYSHTLGAIKATPDGNIFVSTGDGANFNTVDEYALRSQDNDWLGGKVLHVTPTGQGVPENPFYNGNANANRSKVWASGLRNPYRFNLKPGTKVPYLGDVGWHNWEEQNVATKGANFGWPCYEGNGIQAGYQAFAPCQALYAQGPSAVKAPLITWDHNAGTSAATGGAFYTGTSYPAEYRGKYFYGDYAQQWIRYLEVNDNHQAVGNPTDFTSDDSTVDIQMGPDGNLYYLGIWSGELKCIVYGDATCGGSGGDPGGGTNQAPNVTINGPSPTLKWKVGDRIEYSGSATDPEDGALPANALSWRIMIHHCSGGDCHAHQLREETGAGGSFIAPDHGDQVYFQLVLTARDSGGKTATKSIELQPQEAKLTLDSTPAGSQVVMDGLGGTAPLTRTFVVGSEHTIFAPSPQGDKVFESWSDGKAQQHNVVLGAQDTKYTARFQPAGTGGDTCPKGQFRAEYFPNMTLEGQPSVERCEFDINKEWTDGPPAAGMGDNNFSTRWTGTHDFAAGTYTFKANADDGVRVWVDGEKLIDEWRVQEPFEDFTATKQLTAGEHEVVVEYYEQWGWATAKVSWQRGADEVSCPNGQYLAEYFPNMNLSGTPNTRRCEADINKEWADGPPIEGVGDNNFSTRWTGTHDFAAGTYTFKANSDDGMRVWVDGEKLIDEWRVQEPFDDFYATKQLAAGEHEVRVEYYEQWGWATAKLSWQRGAEQVTCPKGQYLAEYFPNMTLGGAPNTKRCEVGAAINKEWTDGPPIEGVGDNNFSTRWTGTHDFEAGTYTFKANADDGVRVWVDGEKLIDEWRVQEPFDDFYATKQLTAGEHEVRVEYYEQWGWATAKLSWQKGADEVSCPNGQFRAEYFPNMTLSGTPNTKRCEADINKEWTDTAPVSGVGDNTFSVRWTGTHDFEAGTYTFKANSDDGIRVWVDGEKLIDEWRVQEPFEDFTATKQLSAGEHEVVVEYYEQWGWATAKLSWQRNGPG